MSENETIAKEVASQLEKLGIDITTAEGRDAFRDDLRWAQQNRKRCEKVFGATVLIVIGGTLSLVGAFILSGAQNYFKGGGGQ